MSSNVETGALAGGLRQRRVLHRHEVERAGRERYLQGVPADPLDRCASQLGRLPRPGYGDIGDVDRSDRPAAPSEPDRVGSLATTDVERPARGEVGDLGDEPAVRPPAPHRPITVAVPRIPLGGLRRRAEALLAVLVPLHGCTVCRQHDDDGAPGVLCGRSDDAAPTGRRSRLDLAPRQSSQP